MLQSKSSYTGTAATCAHGVVITRMQFLAFATCVQAQASAKAPNQNGG